MNPNTNTNSGNPIINETSKITPSVPDDTPVRPLGMFGLLVLKTLENPLVKTGIMLLVRVDIGMIRAARNNPTIKAHKASMLDRISEN